MTMSPVFGRLLTSTLATLVPKNVILKRVRVPDAWLATMSSTTSTTTYTRNCLLQIRAGSTNNSSEATLLSSNATAAAAAFEIHAHPAPGTPFHYAFPVHNLDAAKHFYGEVLGCQEGRSSTKWQDYSLHGHQIVCHWVGDDYRCVDYYNPVDGDDVPVPHAGLALTVEQFHELASRLSAAGVEFIIEPHLRFQGMPGEQYTMFFKDPSGNNLEFKAMTKPENLFAKYNVNDD
jgi:extradiol dioxygenase family protein